MAAPEYIVIEKWQWQRYTAAAVTIAVILLSLLGLGYYLGNRHSINLIEENENLLAQVETNDSEVDDLQRKLVMQEQINKVEQAASKEAGQSMETQFQKFRELERELSFYRSILAPSEANKGLQISRFHWQAISDNKVGWQVSLLQAGSQGGMMSGTFSMNLISMRGTEEIRTPILNKSNKPDFGFKFRYFQHLTGEMDLTNDIVPVAIEIIAKRYGPRQTPLTKQFPWNPEEETATDVE